MALTNQDVNAIAKAIGEAWAKGVERLLQGLPDGVRVSHIKTEVEWEAKQILGAMTKHR